MPAVTNTPVSAGTSADDRRLLARPLAHCLLLTILGLAAACSSSTGTSSQSAPSTTAATTTTTTPAPTIETVLAALAPAGATNPLPATAENDENDMLGRPGGYTARVAFELPGGDLSAKVGAIERGGGFEIWPDAAGAKKRLDYIEGILSSAPILGTEYDYLAGTVLVRVTGKVTPANAKKVEEAVKGLPR